MAIMAMSKDDRLARAKKYLAIAESKDAKRDAYKAAAEEIAAYKQESGATWDALASALGRTAKTLRQIDQWRRSGFKAASPFLMDEQATTRASISHTKKILRDAPLEQVERIVADLPKDRQRAIAAAAGDSYLQRVQGQAEQEQSMTSGERREREEAQRRIVEPIKRVAATFQAEQITSLLEQATETLREAVSDGHLTAEVMRKIEEASEAWTTELGFARQLAGSEA